MTHKFLILIVLLVTGCSYASYDTKPGGETHAEGFDIGTDRALSGFRYKATPDGARTLSIDDVYSSRSDSLDKINRGLQLIIEGAVAGAK